MHPVLAHWLSTLQREYNLENLPDFPSPVVLDIGANVGGFTLYALRRWPGARVISYEPHAKTFVQLAESTSAFANVVDIRRSAVVYPWIEETARLYEGLTGSCEGSLRDDVRWPHLSQKLEEWTYVRTTPAYDLPPADVVKVDTEGSEVAILTGYRYLYKASVLLVESHAVGGDRAGQERTIREIAAKAGLVEQPLPEAVLRFVRA